VLVGVGVLVPVGVKRVLRLLEVRGVSVLIGMGRVSVSVLVGIVEVSVSVEMGRAVSVEMGRAVSVEVKEVSVELMVVTTDGVASGSPNKTDKQRDGAGLGSNSRPMHDISSSSYV